MTDILSNTLRILFDLQACQSGASRNRGVGRYSQSLFSAVSSMSGDREIYSLTSDNLSTKDHHKFFANSKSIRLPPLPSWDTGRDFDGGDKDSLNSVSYSSFVQTIRPDIIHVSHVFEGFDENVALPHLSSRLPGQLYSATLYDLIPLRFQSHYFQNPYFKKWYLSRLNWLRQADILLAISESTRQDAIDLLNIEPSRIVTIHGGVGAHFKPPNDRVHVRKGLHDRYPLKNKIILYTGGDDYRKNLTRAIQGFANINPKLRKDAQLVIVCDMSDMRKKKFNEIARKTGVYEDILITGYVPEQDLVDFCSICDVFIFPSLYEGLGLPVLEAMACGAPVIGGNNSSISEIINRQDALFDAESVSSIANAIENVLSNSQLADDLRDYGVRRAGEYTWQRSAGITLEAFDEVIANSRNAGVKATKFGWIPRKKLAVFSPLPPCRSGIADYNAHFLPFLSRHFDIDLYVDGCKVDDQYINAAYRIYDAKDFEFVADMYDAILYEFGNSEFHTHMVELLEKYPGVAGLHDAYLGGMYGYSDFHLGNTGSYQKEMLYAHGTRARKYLAPRQFHPDGVGVSMVELPCTKRILDAAIAVISHSPFNLSIARQNYPEGWRSQYRTINQMVLRPERIDAHSLLNLKKYLGFNDGDFVITTFGHITWTKIGDRLLDAYIKLATNGNKKIFLVYAGELAKDEFGGGLNNKIKKLSNNIRVRITGYLSEQDYEAYLRVTDLAIQLRSNSRGGTPKGVLDCLAHRVPVIVNNSASYQDYPNDVVIKVSENPGVDEISECMLELSEHLEILERYSQFGFDYIKNNHDPCQCAAEYAAAIHEFGEQSKRNVRNSWYQDFMPYIASCANPSHAKDQSRQWLDALEKQSFSRRRILIDVSHITQKDHNTGIQRVVKEIVSALYCSDRPGIEPVAVQLVKGQLILAKVWLESQGLILPCEAQDDVIEPIEFEATDILIMLDSSWEIYSEFSQIFKMAKQRNVPIYTVIYDMLPITLPGNYFVAGGSERFTKWFRSALTLSDGLICISKTIADDVVGYITENNLLTMVKKISFWHLGANFSNNAIITKQIKRKFSCLGSIDYLLMVGTIEPRKSHQFALDVMEIIWQSGGELALCIVGKEGWLVESLMKRLRSHPMLGKKLFLFEKATDGELDFLYKNSAGLLFLSKGEGFGLPLIEASYQGIPIICSDIPVFREVAGDYATYVNLDSSDITAKMIKAWLEDKKNGHLPDTRNMPSMSWKESSEQLLRVVLDDYWYWRL